MKRWPLLVLILCLVGVQYPLKHYMDNRPLAVKLGYMPSGKALRYIAGSQKSLMSELAVLKVLFYFGSLVEQWQNRVSVPPEYSNMYRTVESAAILDPYNMDAYYFAQAAFTWEIGHAADVNALLSHGMKYRNWDWYLPFFRGFNKAYFRQEYTGAADDMKRAAELSGNPLFSTLAARYFYESGRNELGVAFLRSLIQGEQDSKVKRAYQARLEALEGAGLIEEALGRFRKERGVLPANLTELLQTGYLEALPSDPYGGEFYIDDQGRVRSTSVFSKGKIEKEVPQ